MSALLTFITGAASMCVHGFIKDNTLTFWTGFSGLLFALTTLIFVTKQDRIAPSKQSTTAKSNKTIIRTRQTIKFEESITNNISYKNQYINHSYGRSYIEQWKTNNQNGYHMLCVHGFSIPNGITASFIPMLLNNINKTPIKSITSFHLYGRGLSDAPLVPYTISLFLSQITDILTYFELNGPLIVCGVSMGGAIVTVFADKYPHRIYKLITLAPAGFTLKNSIFLKVLTFPVIGDLAITVAGGIMKKMILKRIANEIDVNKYGEKGKKALDKHSNVIKDTFEHHDGYLYALMSTLRYFPMNELMDTFKNLYQRQDFDNKRWIFIWGDKDKTCPIKADDMFADVKILKISGVGHADVVQEFCLKRYGQELVEWLNMEV